MVSIVKVIDDEELEISFYKEKERTSAIRKDKASICTSKEDKLWQALGNK